LGVDHSSFSPRVQQKIVHAGVNNVSYQQASRDLAELSDLSVAPKPVERMVKKIGQERIDQRDAAVESHKQLPLMAKDVVASSKRSCPQVAMVSVDGGRLQTECVDSDPRKLVFESMRYLKNNADRMRYDDFRRQGLPIMTSAVESVIKMINRRVKGSEKFWSEPGAEAVLQLRADYLSETEIMSRFWLEREAQASCGRPYRRAA
jgi:histone H3/H4